MALRFYLLTTVLALCPARAEETTPAVQRAEKPILLFVGDSITVGKPTGHPEYEPSIPNIEPKLKKGAYGYFEALVEATRDKDLAMRFEKLGNGGQGLTGWIGLTCKKVLTHRHADFNTLPATLIVQDYITGKSPEELKDIETALREMHALSVKAGTVRLVWSTVATDPKGSSGLKAPDDRVAATNEVILKVAKELAVPVVRLDLAWARYIEFTKDKTPVRDWILTNQVHINDGVHPGKVGAFFQALVFARELGISAKQFNENAPALGLPNEQAVELKNWVYGWKDEKVISAK